MKGITITAVEKDIVLVAPEAVSTKEKSVSKAFFPEAFKSKREEFVK